MTKTKKTPVKKTVKKAAPAKKTAAKKPAPKKAATPKAAVKKTVAAKPAVKKAVAKKAAAPKAAAKIVKKTKPTLAEFISAALDKDKAVNIVSIDLRGKTSIADFMTIATGTSSRHLAALARHLKDSLKAEFGIISRIEGDRVGDWVILDAGDVIVHLFREEIRQTYNLEKLWGADFSTVNYTLYHSS